MPEKKSNSTEREHDLFSVLRWYYATRVLGVAMICFGILADHTAERGTIILTGAGLLGFDKVARTAPPADIDDEPVPKKKKDLS